LAPDEDNANRARSRYAREQDIRPGPSNNGSDLPRPRNARGKGDGWDNDGHITDSASAYNTRDGNINSSLNDDGTYRASGRDARRKYTSRACNDNSAYRASGRDARREYTS